jgi:hypothetical protein
MKPNDGKGGIPNRDSKGRFFPAGQMDPQQTVTHRWMEEEEKLAKIYVQVCEQIGQAKLIKFLDIKQYRVGSRTGIFFSGFLTGIGFAIGKGRKKNKRVPVLTLLKETIGVEKNILRFEHKWHELVKQGR